VTVTVDRECWAWFPCQKNEYVQQPELPVDNGMRYLLLES
jgi:hypothetical protein